MGFSKLNFQHLRSQSTRLSSSLTKNLKKYLTVLTGINKKYLLTAVGVVILLVVGIKAIGGSDDRVKLKEAKSVHQINRSFTFPLRDAEGEQVSRINYTVEKAELLDEIVVKGQRATAVKGRTFLIVTLKVLNEFSQPIEIDTRDYIRLVINGNEVERIAPDIHNDPVEVQAISTKFTRVGFPINENEKDLVLQIGEINSEKESISLDL